MPKASVGDMILCSVKKGKPELRKKGNDHFQRAEKNFVCTSRCDQELLSCSLADFVRSMKFDQSPIFDWTAITQWLHFFLFFPLFFLPTPVLQGVIIRQRKPWRRREGIYIYCEGELIYYSVPRNLITLIYFPLTLFPLNSNSPTSSSSHHHHLILLFFICHQSSNNQIQWMILTCTQLLQFATSILFPISPLYTHITLNSTRTDNAGVIVNQKGEMKGSAINGPVGRECAEIWPKIASAAGSVF
jgi:ribosomal protein L14